MLRPTGQGGGKRLMIWLPCLGRQPSRATRSRRTRRRDQHARTSGARGSRPGRALSHHQLISRPTQRLAGDGLRFGTCTLDWAASAGPVKPRQSAAAEPDHGVLSLSPYLLSPAPLDRLPRNRIHPPTTGRRGRPVPRGHRPSGQRRSSRLWTNSWGTVPTYFLGRGGEV